MKIRDGFVTNSSSTSFIMLTKNNFSMEYLMDKLGIESNSPLYDLGCDLYYEIKYAIERGHEYYIENEKLDDYIKSQYSEQTYNQYLCLKEKGYKVYIGELHSDNSILNSFMCMDSFIINEDGFYMNAEKCTW